MPCTAVAFCLFVASIADVGPVRATVITDVTPAVAALLGVPILDESFTVGMSVGLVRSLLGSVRARRPSPAPAPVPLARSEPVRATE
jgi:drug/metabolite transporter (DMT)-like permease